MADGTLEAALARELPAGVALRPREAADLPFLAALYASTREEELRPVDWPPERKQAFLQDQFDKQHQHYLQYYAGARWLVIEHRGERIGRLYAQQTGREIRLMDVALLPPWRNRGLGSALMRGLLAHADAHGLPVTLHVEPFNPALRLYLRLGFRKLESRGYYDFMERRLP